MLEPINVVVATTVVSLLSLVGVFALSLKEKTLHSILFVVVAFSAGSILGAVYFDLLPEAMELAGGSVAAVYITLGFTVFFFLERFIYWYHGHGHESDISAEMPNRATAKSFGYLNILGDGIHNFVDGTIIAGSFLAGFPVGLATTIAVIFHELPQEIGDYGILVYAGFKRGRALLLNFVVALAVILGGILAVIFLETVQALGGVLVAFSAGGFIYLGASELIPELHEEKRFTKSVVQFVMFLLGIALIWALGFVFPE
ncbi:MAG: ZIP family metal transporter [Nitrososphaeria archaeon]